MRFVLNSVLCGFLFSFGQLKVRHNTNIISIYVHMYVYTEYIVVFSLVCKFLIIPVGFAGRPNGLSVALVEGKIPGGR